ncbi:UDP-N-acetylglucosamine 2-epimerase [candidate division WWE3 bacterium CG10_big_fil_rev_8_21_14_0_10_32_10]|uniref:UDP-N-acetylglucosamine 2-epimerase n=1 Tax=candidate division WWE3 bacterium CG10_big_fil_rev_8_21_14_0_10_32_10 TaxID=1975090 RepID=A0A2H0RB54_UNCKA|nr:MAG: UDP-N-acetylglucosamine 2-epimerase [candidate division WWE3 bacterium CG10_big_fil_rev_8_21_14_0_10_32_10]
MKNEKNRYYFFVGTIAELIKVIPVIKKFKDNSVPFKIISTGQNIIQTSDTLKLASNPEIDIILSNSLIKQSALGLVIWWFKTFFIGTYILKKEFLKNKNNYIIVHGDTVSTVMGALIGKIYKVKVVHIESGLRSFNLLNPFPEEIDRIIVSSLTDIHFCPNEWALINLKSKNGIKINTKYNTLVDSLHLALSHSDTPSFAKKLGSKKYFMFVMHRQENLARASLVKSIISEIVEVSKTTHCVFVMHDLTKETLKNINILNSLEKNKNITLVGRQPYIHFMKLMSNCEFIITDGGSNQEESSYFGVPCLLLRTHTERIEGLNKNVVLSRNDPIIIHDFVLNYKKYRRKSVEAKNSPSTKIFTYLQNNNL